MARFTDQHKKKQKPENHTNKMSKMTSNTINKGIKLIDVAQMLILIKVTIGRSKIEWVPKRQVALIQKVKQ